MTQPPDLAPAGGTPAAFTGTVRDGRFVLAASGRWDLAAAAVLEPGLAACAPAPGLPVEIDLGPVEAVDTVGALLLHQFCDRMRGEGRRVDLVNAAPGPRALMAAVWQADAAEARGTLPHPCPTPILDMVERVGRATVASLCEARDLLNFLGLLTVTLGRSLLRPRRLRLTAIFFHMEQAGLNALPIVGLLSFLIGVVLAYQGADQLRQFGAQIYAVNLLGISILREIGVLMTAIIVAGRSGSAFTAQIGTMKVNQEVDALRTLGLDPVELLVLPRTLALLVALPLLAFYACVMGLLGGALMCNITLDISFAQFIRQLRGAIAPHTAFVGLIKAPVFAVLIALVGCYEGLKVSGSAESVGRLTTASVVIGIFLVIVVDALFSILFSYLRV